jgi:orotate phosphoribosyltransferase
MTLVHALKPFVKHGDFVLSSGEHSNIYFDVKEAYSDPEIFKAICDSLWNSIDSSTTCIAARGIGGMPIVSALSYVHNIPFSLIRDTPKDHGVGKLIEIYSPTEKDLVSIFDDVFTTGGNIKKIAEALEPTKAKILGGHVVIKRGEGELPFPLHYLLKLEDLI